MKDQFQITLNIDVCRTLYQAVCDALEVWPGTPARPPEQQEEYKQMKLFLFSIICEANYDLWTQLVLTYKQNLKKHVKVKANIQSLLMDVNSYEGKESNI